MMMTPNECEQTQLLEKARNTVKVQSFHMQRALDGNRLMEALGHANEMLNELRIGSLAPKSYFDLYSVTVEYLRYVEVYLYDGNNRDNIGHIYKVVQYFPNIIPRLYLLITVGGAYIKIEKSSAEDVLNDLMEMCRGIQHPTRGLFLRSYLMEITKDKLPLPGSPYYASDACGLTKCIGFIMTNFTEMNKLWVRMRHQVSLRDKDKCEQERRQLNTLVGKNISYLSTLEGVDFRLYSRSILPKLSAHIIACQDPIAQFDLVEIAIHVISIEWHIHTLKGLLKMFIQLEPEVNVVHLIAILLDHVIEFLDSIDQQLLSDSFDDSSIPPFKKASIFLTLFKHTTRIISMRPFVSSDQVVAIMSMLICLCSICFKDNYSHVEDILNFTLQYLNRSGGSSNQPEVSKKIHQLLCSPNSVGMDYLLKMISLPSYVQIIELLGPLERRSIAINVTKSIIGLSTVIKGLDAVQKICRVLNFIFYDESVSTEDDNQQYSEELIEGDCNLLSTLVHKFGGINTEEDCQIIDVFRQFFLSSRYSSSPMKNKALLIRLYPALVFKYLKLIEKMNTCSSLVEESNRIEGDDHSSNQSTFRRIFECIIDMIKPLETKENSLLILGLYLQCTQTASRCRLPKIVGTFMEKSLLLYENLVPAIHQFDAWNQIAVVICTLYPLLSSSDPEDCDSWTLLVTNCARNARNMLVASDRSITVSRCAHMYWASISHLPPEERDVSNVLKCLDYSLRVGGNLDAIDIDPLPLVHLLNQYIYFLPDINVQSHISHLIKLIHQFFSLDDHREYDQARITSALTFFNNTIQHIEHHKRIGTAFYQNITLGG